MNAYMSLKIDNNNNISPLAKEDLFLLCRKFRQSKSKFRLGTEEQNKARKNGTV